MMVSVCMWILVLIHTVMKDVHCVCEWSDGGDGCNTCSGDKCVVCHNGYYLDVDNNRCLKCMDDCYNCDFLSFCNTCKDTYYQKIVDKPNTIRVCVPCPYGCQFCYPVDHITKTTTGEPTCDTCKQGYYRYLSQHSALHLCEKCSEDCMECEGSPKNCTRCKDGLNLVGNTCEEFVNSKPILIVGIVMIIVLAISIIVCWSRGDTNIDIEKEMRRRALYYRKGKAPPQIF